MSDPGLLVLSRSDIARLMTYEDYVVAVESAFVAAAKGEAVAPPAAALHVRDGSFHAKGAALLGNAASLAIVAGLAGFAFDNRLCADGNALLRSGSICA